MKIAHLSDLHLYALDHIETKRLFNKRFSGWVNMKLKREHKHQQSAAIKCAKAVREGDYDHVVITGDFTNLALEQEFEMVRQFLDDTLALPPERVSIVPGNHDRYTRGSEKQRRFESYLAPYVQNDLDSASGAIDESQFPYVHLRGPVAIIGIDSAVSRLPLVAAGTVGRPQRMALRAILAHEQVQQRTPLMLIHHPVHNPPGRMHTFMEGLRDALDLHADLDGLTTGLILHGHLHRRIHRTLRTHQGQLEVYGSTSSSLVVDAPERRSGFNVYHFNDDGVLLQADAERLSPCGNHFETTSIPSATTA